MRFCFVVLRLQACLSVKGLGLETAFAGAFRRSLTPGEASPRAERVACDERSAW